MYVLKPVVSMPAEHYQPKSMYRLKNIHEAQDELSNHTSNESTTVSDITEQVIKFLKNPLPEVAKLEIRQEKILTQLAELKEQVANLCGILKNCNESEPFGSTSCTNEERISVDFVINVSPSRPPYSILALQNIWKDTDIKISSYFHSSISIPTLKFPIVPRNLNNANNNIAVSLIWKKVIDTEVVISGVRGPPLTGEINLLRYMYRLIANHNYEGTCDVEAAKIDAVLDLCQELSFQKSSKDAHTVLSVLSKKLGSGQWLAGQSKLTIADVAAWSAIKQLHSVNLPGNLSNWFKTSDSVFWNK